MSEITTVGLDLAKRVVSVCGEDAMGRVVMQRTLRREAVLAWFVPAPALHRRDGGLFERALVRAGVDGARPHRAHHRAGVRAAIPVVGEERRQRCGGDLCGGAPAAAALRDGEDGPFKLHRTLTLF